MSVSTEKCIQSPSVQVEDVVLTLLILCSLPLSWIILKDESFLENSIADHHMLESTVLIILGVVVCLLSLIWLGAIFGPVLFAIAKVSGSAPLWKLADLITPKFIRRLLVLSLGTQFFLLPGASAMDDTSSHSSASPIGWSAELPDSPRHTIGRQSSVQTPDKDFWSPKTPTKQGSRTTATTYIVKPGDCLWDIAHRELGANAHLADVEDRWHQWWQTNRQAIGTNPHLLRPGTELSIPAWT